MELNTTDKVLTFKIVYYGPALGGKTTNLITMHRLTDPSGQSELVSIATQDDRTLFFDLLPMEMGKFFGFELKLKLYTVPGQVRFDVTRRRVLGGADAIVFVADSRPEQQEANALALKNLKVNLIQNHLDPATLPMVIQHNKRDLDGVVPIEEMNRALLAGRVCPTFPAVATSGAGVMETVASVVSDAVHAMAVNRKIAAPPEAKRVAGILRDKLVAFAVKEGATGPTGVSAQAPAGSAQAGTGSGKPGGAASAATGAGKAAASPGAPAGEAATPGSADESHWAHHANVKITDEVDLLEEAVGANLALTDRVARLRDEVRRLSRRERQIRGLGLLARFAADVTEPGRITHELLAVTLHALGLSSASILTRGNHGVTPVSLHGLTADPLAAVPSPPLTSLAERLVASGRTVVTNDLHADLGVDPARLHMPIAGLVFSPLRLGESFAGVFLYATQPEHLDALDESFVDSACRIVSLARTRTPVTIAR